MSNNYLGRDDAPFGESLWKAFDNAMMESAKPKLTGRRLLHVDGPHGLGLKYVPLRDYEVEDGIFSTEVLPLIHLHKSFAIKTRDLAAFEKDSITMDLSSVAKAALWCASTEDKMIFYGTKINPGLMNQPKSNRINLSSWEEKGASAEDIINAVTKLDEAGFHGPYCLALSPKRYNLLFRQYNCGGSELQHLNTIIAHGVFKAPMLEKGGVILASGSHFASIILGQDMQIGFTGPAGIDFEFTISESFALKVQVPESICALDE